MENSDSLENIEHLYVWIVEMEYCWVLLICFEDIERGSLFDIWIQSTIRSSNKMLVVLFE